MPRKYQSHQNAPELEDEFIELYRRLDKLEDESSSSTSGGPIRYLFGQVSFNVIPHTPQELTFEIGGTLRNQFVPLRWGARVLAHRGVSVDYELYARGQMLPVLPDPPLTDVFPVFTDKLLDVRPSIGEINTVINGGGNTNFGTPIVPQAVGSPLNHEVVVHLPASQLVVCHRSWVWVEYAELDGETVKFTSGCQEL